MGDESPLESLDRPINPSLDKTAANRPGGPVQHNCSPHSDRPKDDQDQLLVKHRHQLWKLALATGGNKQRDRQRGIGKQQPLAGESLLGGCIDVVGVMLRKVQQNCAAFEQREN